MQTTQFELHPHDNQRLANMCGLYDEHLHLIEQTLRVTIRNRGHHFEVTGQAKAIAKASQLLKQLYEETTSDQLLTLESMQLFLQTYKRPYKGNTNKMTSQQASMSCSNTLAQQNKLDQDDTPRKPHPKMKHHPLQAQQGSGIIHTRHHVIKAYGQHQKHYVDNIRSHAINFSIGPSGTGKTYLAVACAVSALERNEVKRIILVRPAVEAGEKLGFLPGDLQQKVDPYLRPLYDGLFDLLGLDHAAKLIERNVIEVAPLAYMRGRTLNEAFIILDESQNTTIVQMKMFLTRLGFGSTVVVTGDTTQTDLRGHKLSGLEHAMQVLQHIENISFTHFDASDVVRHPLVQAVVEAYDQYEYKQEHNKR